MSNTKVLLSSYTAEIDEDLRTSIPAQEGLSLYQHLEYFLGFRDENLHEVSGYGGKRFRSAICLMLGDWYGSKEAALPVATSIELFHNFTLIHDDIVDEDESRRGRPTVWKLFGTDHAINDGDAQLVIALQHILRSPALSDGEKTELQSFLLGQYLRVIEGQYMDFSLTRSALGDEFVTKEHYLSMITRKTADLVAAATKGAGAAAGVDASEQEMLFELGETLGVAYQMYDDMVSIWGTAAETGKQEQGDLYEKKKSLPVLHAYEMLEEDQQERLMALYNKEKKPTKKEVAEMVALLHEADAHTYMKEEIMVRKVAAKALILKLSLSDDQKVVLRDIVADLLPDDTLPA